ncbi:MAG: carbon-nitrogen hydrolase [Gammaproteobacteria bacterium]
MTLTVALLQMICQANRQANLDHIAQSIDSLAKQGVQLVLLPELHNGLYFCQTENSDNFDLAESIPGPSTDFFSALASQHQIVIVASLFEKRTAGLYHNTAVVFDSDGRIAGKYRKMHIPDDPGYYEKFYFTPGDPGFKPIDTRIGRLGVLICWDQWYPEAARLMTLAGADLLLYPTAIGWDKRDSKDEQQRQQSAWMLIQRSHAVANGLPVLCCNRSGYEADPSGATSGIQFWGTSFICGPQGELLAQATAATPQTLIYPLDLQRSESVRRSWPFLRDRRIDSYDALSARFLDEN